MIGRNADFSRRLLQWYHRYRRNLPWRLAPDQPGPLDPYHVLLSETMLQQTQVATVIPYFHRFLAKLPTFQQLAEAQEQDVLRLWQGLGYYSRARNLHAAARMVVSEFGGTLPTTVEELLKLPGVGRYTAGAIASIAFEVPAPILDGNVTRVICRIDAIRSDPRDKGTLRVLWRRAEEILPKRRPGDFNSAMMELGATVCIPRNPQCLICPVRQHCQAAAGGLQDVIPPEKKSKEMPLVRRRTFCIRHNGKWLIEQRPSRGRWASMWQFVTIDPEKTDQPPVVVRKSRHLGIVTHGLTHRRYEFDVFAAEAAKADLPICEIKRDWVSTTDLDRYPLPRPHLKMLDLLKAEGLV